MEEEVLREGAVMGEEVVVVIVTEAPAQNIDGKVDQPESTTSGTQPPPQPQIPPVGSTNTIADVDTNGSTHI